MYNKEGVNQHKKIINLVLSELKQCICCKKKQKIIRCDVCQSMLYCSEVCRKNDEIKHLKECKKQIVVIQNQQNNKTQSGYQMGLVGLENIGNTCYLNSSLQCLSHTTALTQYFYDQHYKNEINYTNPMGSQGRVVQRYADFIRNMWFGKQQVYKPIQLKKQIGMRNPQFAYKSQEDANQFLITLIDLIHEDLNRITQRPQIQRPDTLGKCPQDAAKITWLYNYRFNQSIIIDLMTGLYRSIVYCRECKKQSSTFQPYRTINLPIPNQNEQKQLKFYVLYDNFRKPVISSSIVYKLIQQKKLAQEAAKKIGEENKTFKLYFLSKSNDIQNCEQIQQLSTFQTIMEDEQAFLIQLSPLQEAIVNKCTLTFFFSNQKNNSIWLKRPFFIDIEFETGQSILKRIFKYLYNSVYKYPQKLTILGMEGTSYEKYETQMLKQQIFVLKLMKIKGRYGRIVYYQDQIGETLQRDQLILDSMKQLMYEGQHKQNQAQNLPVSQIEKQFELKIEICGLAYKFFDFQKLYSGIQEFKKQGYKKKIENNYQIDKLQHKNVSKVSFEKCLDAFGSDERLHGDITWYCSQCQKQTKANKRISIYQTPDVLIFVLNRFKVRQDGRKQKIKRPVDIPFEINMEKYVTDHRPMSCYIEHAKKRLIYKNPPYTYEPSTKPIQRFELYAFIRHDGQISHGHYTAYAKNSVQWYFFNDKSVSQVNYNQIQKNNAYILFYRRKKK